MKKSNINFIIYTAYINKTNFQKLIICRYLLLFYLNEPQCYGERHK